VSELPRLSGSLRVDPLIPPGVIVMRSGIDQVISVSRVTHIHAETIKSDALAEDARSLIESAPYVVRYGDAGSPIACECCGSPVALMSERPAGETAGAWKPGIWEPELTRKHTLRRCEWKRANP
jgi:hypothetical protein